MTLRSFVHPLDAHGSSALSGTRGRRQRAGRGEQVEHPPAEPVVGGEPPRDLPVPAAQVDHVGEVQPEVRHRPHHGEGRLDLQVLAPELEQRAVLLEGLPQLVRLVGVAEAGPGDEVGTGRDHGGRVELEVRQPIDDRQQVGGSVGVEELRPHRDPASLVAGQPPHERCDCFTANDPRL